MISEKILLVDDDETVLRSYKRHLSLDFEITTAVGGEAGLQRCEQDGPFAVVVSDMRMPGMDGTRFLSTIYERWPHTVRMLLTGQADMKDAIAVVNEGHLFRFLTKPCVPPVFARALRDGLQQYRLVQSEKDLLDNTLKGSMQVLLDVLSLVSPGVFGRAVRVRNLANRVGRQLKLDEIWQVEIAALFSQIGCITVPPEILQKKYRGLELKEEEMAMFAKHISVGKELLSNIPRLEVVAEAIAYQEKHFDGSGLPAGSRRGRDLPLVARILHVVQDFVQLTHEGESISTALSRMSRDTKRYDPEVVAALAAVSPGADGKAAIREISPRLVQAGMVVAADVRTKGNILLIAKGQEISDTLRICIWNFANNDNIAGTIKIIEEPVEVVDEVDSETVPSSR